MVFYLKINFKEKATICAVYYKWDTKQNFLLKLCTCKHFAIQYFIDAYKWVHLLQRQKFNLLNILTSLLYILFNLKRNPLPTYVFITIIYYDFRLIYLCLHRLNRMFCEVCWYLFASFVLDVFCNVHWFFSFQLC